MKRFVHTLAILVVLGMAFVTSVAHAEPTAKDKAHARELYAMGQTMFRAGDFAGAEKSFQEAYVAVPNPIVLLSIAECQVRTEKFTEAVVSLTRYLEERPNAPDREQVEAQIQKLRDKPGIVTIESTPPGALISVDGMTTSLMTPADVELTAGDHLIAVESPGYSAAEQSVTVLIGSRQTVTLAPMPLRAPEPAPVPDVPKVDLKATATSRGMLPVWIATGVAGVGAVTGAILGGLALKKKGEFDVTPSEKTADKGERLALFADVGFGIAAAAGITAIVLYVTRDKDESKSKNAWSLKPNLSKNNLGLSGNVKF